MEATELAPVVDLVSVVDSEEVEAAAAVVVEVDMVEA